MISLPGPVDGGRNRLVYFHPLFCWGDNVPFYDTLSLVKSILYVWIRA